MSTEKPESRLQRKIIEALRARGGWWVKLHGGPYQQVGLPDLLGCVNGRFIMFEVKCPGGKTTARQGLTIEAIQAQGGIAAVVYSPEQAIKILKEAGVYGPEEKSRS